MIAGVRLSPTPTMRVKIAVRSPAETLERRSAVRSNRRKRERGQGQESEWFTNLSELHSCLIPCLERNDARRADTERELELRGLQAADVWAHRVIVEQ